MKSIFEPSGEPTLDEDPQRPEEYINDSHWKPGNREAWQKHSEKGPNVQPESKTTKAPPAFE